MTDEKYVFTQDSQTKKNIARSASKRRTHNGKGGRVRLPSDNLSKKELKAMSGECKSYRLNEPMNYREFKAMPDDLKVTYIKLLREKYGVPDCKIADMMGVNKVTFSVEIKRIGLGHGEKHGGYKKWDTDGFYAWCGGSSVAKQEEEIPVEEEPVAEEPVVEDIKEVLRKGYCEDAPAEIPVETYAIPHHGNMTFNGRTEEILKTVGCLLRNADVRIHITWELVDNV